MNRTTEYIRGAVQELHHEDRNLDDYFIEVCHADMVQIKRDGWVVENERTAVYGIEVRLNRSVQEPMLVHRDNEV